MMSEETWLTASEAVEMGFANKAIGSKQVTNENLLKMVARYDAPKQIVNSITQIKMENKSFIEQIKDFFNTKKEIETLQNEMSAPIVNEYEAKLKAEQDANAALQAQLAEAQAISAQVTELQAKLEAIKAEAAPSEQPVEEPSPNDVIEEQETTFTQLENSIKSLFSPNQLEKQNKAIAMQAKIAEIENKRKTK